MRKCHAQSASGTGWLLWGGAHGPQNCVQFGSRGAIIERSGKSGVEDVAEAVADADPLGAATMG